MKDIRQKILSDLWTAIEGDMEDVTATQEERLALSVLIANKVMDDTPSGMTEFAHLLDVYSEVQAAMAKVVRGRLRRLSTR